MSFEVKRVDHEVLAALISQTEAVHVQGKETVAPVIASLEQHARLLRALFRTPVESVEFERGGRSEAAGKFS